MTQLAVEIEKVLKNCELYLNIYSRRNFEENETSQLRLWIYALKTNRSQSEDELTNNLKTAIQLLDSIMNK
jgi:hypothetical protein